MRKFSMYYPVKLVMGILLNNLAYKIKLEKELTGCFGEPDYASEVMDFTFSNYYHKEMGSPLKKYFLAFKNLHLPQQMAEIKLRTIELEKKFYREGRRCINLDPGHLFLSRFILTTTKDGSHRIPLHTGIYAEITLLYENHTFRPVEWTYPDFKDNSYLRILNEIRALYKPQLKAQA